MEQVHDYIVIGSGFGGSVAALRLSEKGYSVLVLEQGKRYQAKDFATNNWQIWRFLWAPLWRCFGILQLSFFNEAIVVSGVGVGGGSLVYGNTHMTPSRDFFTNPAWRGSGDWQQRLAPFYQLARRMLGTTTVPELFREDHALQQVAHQMACGDSFAKVEVGVYFGDPQKATDPYFDGQGPLRRGCTLCAGCMVGCRHEAKNTLDKNYLHLAQNKGAQIRSERRVEKIEFKDGLYHIHSRRSTAWRFLGGQDRQVHGSRGLVMAAGVLGTLQLLFEQKYKYKTLTLLSNRLGHNLRTNSESLCGVGDARVKLNHGVAISSVISPDAHTQVQICKYPDGSGLLSRLAVMAAGDGAPPVRLAKSFLRALRHPWRFLKMLFDFNFANHSVFLLVMQDLDNAMRMVFRRRLWGWRLQMQNNLPPEQRVPAYIPQAQAVMHAYAREVGGLPLNSIGEVAFNISSTAHILGGCPMGDSAAEGVVDSSFRAFNYPRLHIVDGSIIPCNLGVNPSLTITALAEYAMSTVPTRTGG